MNYEAVAGVPEALEKERVSCLVFGGAALNLQELPRFTEGRGLFSAPDGENIEALKRALRQVFAGGTTAVDPSAIALARRSLLSEE